MEKKKVSIWKKIWFIIKKYTPIATIKGSIYYLERHGYKVISPKKKGKK